MKYTITLLFQFLLLYAYAQNNFTPSRVDKALLKIPEPLKQDKTNNDIIKAIEIVDKNYRKISDTLYYWKSLPHTIFQNILIETNDSLFINPLSFGSKLNLNSILFNSKRLHTTVKKLAKGLRKSQRNKLYEYLKESYDYFKKKVILKKIYSKLFI